MSDSATLSPDDEGGGRKAGGEAAVAAILALLTGSAGHPEETASAGAAERAALLRRHFPFLSGRLAETLLRYRDEEADLETLADLVRDVADRAGRHPGFDLFLEALDRFCRFVWSRRAVEIGASRTSLKQAETRIALARLLRIDLPETNLRDGAFSFAAIREAVEEIRRSLSDAPVTVHYVEVFSRPSEAFIPDFIARLAQHDGGNHVVICDERMLEHERPFRNLLHLPFRSMSPRGYRHFVEFALEELRVSGFVFHFATNGWRFLSRIGKRFQSLPAVYMCHGVDVFDLHAPGPYRDFILGNVACLPNVAFTAVSFYLRTELEAVGVAADKIAVVGNTPHPRFFRNRKAGRDKTQARLASGFDLRIVNVGRLIRLKGHHTLIEAISLLEKSAGLRASLTIVYGGDDAELATLRSLAERLGVSERVAFRDAVDFDREPRFFDDFDLLAAASTYSDEPRPRSDTFGMSLLEGMAAGLPIVVTDAGGHREVAGPENRFVKIVPPDRPDELAAAIAGIARSGALDEDNLDVARAQLGLYSEEAQMERFGAVTARLRVKRLKVAVFSSGVDHGAGGAAWRVHRSLLASDVASRLYCRYRSEGADNLPAVTVLDDAPRHLGDFVHPAGDFLPPGNTMFSVDTDGIGAERLQRLIEDCDVVNIQWYARFLSTDDIAQILASGKPVVFTVRDMHPLTGGCHYFHGCDNWLHECLPCPQFRPEDIHLPHETFARKRRDWDMANVTVVVLSDHTRAIVERSPLFGGCRIEKIPNPIDLATFAPSDKAEARREFGVPAGRKAVAFVPSFGSTVKGKAEITEMFGLLARRHGRDDIVALCAGAQEDALDIPFETIAVGHIGDRARMARFFSAADVTVIPSLEETFSNTAAESLASGTPVVGFATGAIAELATGRLGKAVPLGDTDALAAAVDAVLSGEDDVSEECHAAMAEGYSYAAIGARYKALFAELAAEAGRRAPSPRPTPEGGTGSLARYLAARLAAAERELEELRRAGGQTRDALQSRGEPADILPLLTLAGGAVRGADGTVRVESGEPGHRLYGPFIALASGRYEAEIVVKVHPFFRQKKWFAAGEAVFEVARDTDVFLGQERIALSPLLNRTASARIAFDHDTEMIAAEGNRVEVRLWTAGDIRLDVLSVTLTRIA